MKNMLSKTDFLVFLEAPMHLWALSQDKLQIKIHTPYEQHLIQQGQQVEELARVFIENILLTAYPDGQLLWQPTYDDGKFTIRADALIWDKNAGVYDLYEIKSSTSIHKKHEYDLTFQVLLLENILNLRGMSILHIDNTYQQGEKLNLSDLFVIDELSEVVEKRREDVMNLRQQAWQVTQMMQPDSSFACTKPNSCPCPDLCHPNLPENPIYDIPYVGKKAHQLREMGIVDIHYIPSSLHFNEKQRKHIIAVQKDQALIDKCTIQEALSSLRYPLYFLDYETFNPAIPLFPGYRPYEHIVFQYSLHKISKPGCEAAHFACLITEKADPAPLIVPDLLKKLGSKGSVIVWNKYFEAGRNKDLMGHCPAYADLLEGINNRLFDLMQLFKDGLYVHPDFHGSASLKAVLPVLCSQLSYQSLPISNGEEAMLTWYWIQSGMLDPDELAKTRSEMLAYCELDTYAMVAILNQLQKIIGGKHES